MRKLLSFHVTSVDGYYEGPNQAFDWPVIDEEFNQFTLQQADKAELCSTPPGGTIRSRRRATGRGGPPDAGECPDSASQRTVSAKVSRSGQGSSCSSSRVLESSHRASQLTIQMLSALQGSSVSHSR